MIVDAERLRNLLNAQTRTRFPWKYTYAYNNAGCPTADFYIPGHNGGATVEILADDAALIVDGLPMLPGLLAVFEAAVRFKEAHVGTVGLSEVEQHLALGKLIDRRDDLLATLIEVLGESNAEEDEDSVPGEGGQSGEI
jgi:hypothetical protein